MTIKALIGKVSEHTVAELYPALQTRSRELVGFVPPASEIAPLHDPYSEFDELG